MIKIGLVGEDPNDTTSIKNLLLKKYKSRVNFYPLAKGIKGYQLDTEKIKKSLPIEFNSKGCKFIIYIRDLDGLQTEKTKVIAREKWFTELDKVINGDGLLLLNIWELEALVLSDIDSFNDIYKIRHKFTKVPMFVKEPKEELKRITHKTNRPYKESHCPDIFQKLSFETIESKCAYFKSFIVELDKKIA